MAAILGMNAAEFQSSPSGNSNSSGTLLPGSAAAGGGASNGLSNWSTLAYDPDMPEVPSVHWELKVTCKSQPASRIS